MDLSPHDQALLDAAVQQAEKSRNEGGIPIGAALGNAEGVVVSQGHNERVQSGDPTAHAEMNTIRKAGRRRDWPTLTLASTLSPCIMCTGASLLFRIPRVIIGENQTFLGAEDLFRQHGVELIVVQDPRCITLMETFIAEQPDLWNEDIGL
ncbi:MAG: nucleoside deaminase [Planctomycetota bacterium]